MNTFLWNKMFRREVIGNVRLIDMERWEDTSFLFRILPRVKKIKFVNEVLYHYRQRNNSLTSGLTEEKYQSALVKFQKAAWIFQEHAEDYTRIKQAFEVQVFMRCAIGGVCRMSLKNMKKGKYYVSQMKVYLEETIPGWRMNPYLSLHSTYVIIPITK